MASVRELLDRLNSLTAFLTICSTYVPCSSIVALWGTCSQEIPCSKYCSTFSTMDILSRITPPPQAIHTIKRNELGLLFISLLHLLSFAHDRPIYVFQQQQLNSIVHGTDILARKQANSQHSPHICILQKCICLTVRKYIHAPCL